MAGAVALGLEVVWTQAAIPFLGTRASAFALVLATYLVGLTAGSAAHARLADRVRRPWVVFGLLELGVGAAAGARRRAGESVLPVVHRAVSHP